MSTATTRAVAGDQQTRGRRLAAPLGAGVAVAAAWAAVALMRPGDAGPSPCVWRAITGLDCPFCGSTRAAAALAHGDLVGALDHNALFVVGVVPLAIAVWLTWLRRAWRGGGPPVTVTPRLLIVLGAVTAAWWALRLMVPWLGSAA